MSASARPLVSVLLPVRDGAATLAEALAGVLGQGLRDLELVAVDDGSTDGTAAILRTAAADDPRVRVVDGGGRGLVAALNQGLSLCAGRYIARMDADDRCRPGRLALQAARLEADPGLGVLGGQVLRFGGPGPRRPAHPVTHEAITAAAVFDCPLVHPTVMFRAALVSGAGPVYDPAEPRAEDYGLWTRWLEAGVRFAALSVPVLDYRVHADQVGARWRAEQARVADKIRLRWLERLGLEPSVREMELHRGAGQADWGRGAAYLAELEAWFLKLRAAGRASAVLDAAAWDAALAQRWTSALWANRGQGPPLRRLIRASPLRALAHPRPWKPWAVWAASFLPAGGA